MKTLLLILISSLALGKTIKEGDKEFTCTPVKTCDEKLKAAYAEIKRLKKELKDEIAIAPLLCEPKVVTVERVVKKVKKHIVSVIAHNTTTESNTSKDTIGPVYSATAEVSTAYVPAITYQYQFESGLTPLIGLDIKKNPKAILGLGIEF